jgi:protein gp37
MADTAIEWTKREGTIGVVWNPTTGCDRVSAGCDHCYALTMAKRLKGMGSAKYQTDGDPRTSGPGFGVATHPGTLAEPMRWRRPRTVFVNSMSDLFHARVPRDFIRQVFAVMNATPQHTYQILTKRASRAALISAELRWTPNIWMGVSVEDAEHVKRIDHLRAIPAAVRFVSAEPLIGPLHEVDLAGISWLIIGGESGPGARAMELSWVWSLIGQCEAARTAPFVKQLGSVWARDTFVGGQAAARLDPKGGDWSFWPEHLRVREYPSAVKV